MSTHELNRHANSEVQLEVMSATTNDGRDDGHVVLRVIDAASGEVLAAVEVPAGRWWRLLQGGTHTSPAFITPHLDRVGKQMENICVKLHGHPTDKAHAIELWEATPNPPGWETYETEEFRRTNQGYVVILRRWVDPT